MYTKFKWIRYRVVVFTIRVLSNGPFFPIAWKIEVVRHYSAHANRLYFKGFAPSSACIAWKGMTAPQGRLILFHVLVKEPDYMNGLFGPTPSMFHANGKKRVAFYFPAFTRNSHRTERTWGISPPKIVEIDPWRMELIAVFYVVQSNLQVQSNPPVKVPLH